MEFRIRRSFQVLAPGSSLRRRVAYSLVIVRLILVPVIFLAVYYLLQIGWILDRRGRSTGAAPGCGLPWRIEADDEHANEEAKVT
jgi:hypothetical protein